MGLINELSLMQEDYRALYRELTQLEDRSYEEALAVPPGMDEEEIIALSTVLFELKHRDPDEVHEADIKDVLWSIEFIDHLDTLGWQVVRKP